MSDEVRFEVQGRLGVAVLDRPRALNALTHGMVRALGRQLAAWRRDAAIGAVLVKAAPGRAFCAGGDIVAVTRLARESGVEAALPFFRDEYRLNWRIHTYPKPYVALIDGITMGGGVGISVHGAFRVATERTLFAMPETGIGFFPDVGATWFLPRCPGAVGMYLGLTGARLRGADALTAGVATHAVPSAALAGIEALVRAAAAAPDPRAAIAEALAGQPTLDEPAELPALRPAIDRCFDAPTLADLLDRLAGEGPYGAALLGELGRKSPFALALTFAQLRRGRDSSIEDALRLEYRMVRSILAGHDFVEGVRALLVDKDQRPEWRPSRLAEVDEAAVAACMTPPPAGDLAFDWHDD